MTEYFMDEMRSGSGGRSALSTASGTVVGMFALLF